MAADSSVLREYLVSLGFKVSQTESKKFEDGLARWDKKANALALGLIGVGTAATAMVSRFAYSMEKLYYASKRTDSAVGSIQALEYGASRIGIGTDKMRGSLEALARNMRANPGLQGLLNSLGVKVEGRDKSDVLTDLVGQLKKMPFYVAEKYANLFGIDPDTLFMLEQGLDELKRAAAERKQMAADMGVDSEKAAEAGKEYANTWREITERVGLFRDAVAIELLPAMQTLAGVTKEVLKDWTAIVQMNPEEFKKKLMEGLGLADPGGGVVLSKESQARLGQAEGDKDYIEGTNLGTGEKYTTKKRWLDRQYDKFMKWGGAKKWQRPEGDDASESAAQDTSQFKSGGTGKAPMGSSYVPNGRGGYTYKPQSSGASELFANLEQKYALPPGTLDRIWKAESNRGDPKYMRSSAGAKGHFGFMDDTAKDMGVKDPDDLSDSASGAAKYYALLLKRYGGDNSKAAAAYNWGMGNVDKKGLGAAPKETRDYMDKVGGGAPAGPGGVTMNQENNINIIGGHDPKSAAEELRRQVDDANATLVRNMKAKVQ